MNRALGLCRRGRLLSARPALLGVGAGAGGIFIGCAPFAQRLRLDAMPAASQYGSGSGAAASPQQRRVYSSKPSPETVRQISSGSITGFGVGFVIALFSRTLVFLGGLLAVASFFAAQQGIDLPQLLGVKRVINKSSFLKKSSRSPLFAASFAVTFTLAAFVRL